MKTHACLARKIKKRWGISDKKKQKPFCPFVDFADDLNHNLIGRGPNVTLSCLQGRCYTIVEYRAEFTFVKEKHHTQGSGALGGSISYSGLVASLPDTTNYTAIHVKDNLVPIVQYWTLTFCNKVSALTKGQFPWRCRHQTSVPLPVLRHWLGQCKPS